MLFLSDPAPIERCALRLFAINGVLLIMRSVAMVVKHVGEVSISNTMSAT